MKRVETAPVTCARPGRGNDTVSSDTYVGAIDQVTTGTRFMLFDRDGRVAANAYERHEQVYPEPGRVEHDATEVWANTRSVIRDALDDAGIDATQLSGTGITNQREATVIWDAETSEPVHNAVVWRDRWTTDRFEALEAAGKDGWTHERTGPEPDPYFSATKAEWLLENADPVATDRSDPVGTGGVCPPSRDVNLANENAGGRLMYGREKPSASESMSLMIDIRKLGLFNRMAKEGGNTVADHLSQMTGMETEMEITKINFIDVPDIKTHVGHEEQIGISIEMTEPPHGHILFLLEAESAKELASGMIGDMGETDPEATGFTDMERSAIQEIGNIMTSGFIDGWANVLDTTIDIGTPTFIFGPGSGMVDDLVGDREAEMALMFDSHVQAPESDVDVKVYTFPELEELVDLMQGIEV